MAEQSYCPTCKVTTRWRWDITHCETCKTKLLDVEAIDEADVVAYLPVATVMMPCQQPAASFTLDSIKADEEKPDGTK